MLTTFTNKMFLQVKRVIGVGATGNIPCIVLQAAFFEGKSYTSAAVNSQLKRAQIGKSQCRKVRGKNTRVTYLYQTAFDQESLDNILKGEKERYCRERVLTLKHNIVLEIKFLLLTSSLVQQCRRVLLGILGRGEGEGRGEGVPPAFLNP